MLDVVECIELRCRETGGVRCRVCGGEIVATTTEKCFGYEVTSIGVGDDVVFDSVLLVTLPRDLSSDHCEQVLRDMVLGSRW